ncbi:Uncharacterised protein g5566 [Pycnogonum litorale]
MSSNVVSQKVLYGGRSLKVLKVKLHEVPVDAIVIPTDSNFGLDSPAAQSVLRILGSELKRIVKDAIKTHGVLSKPARAIVQRSTGIKSPNIVFCNVPENSTGNLEMSIKNCLNVASNAGLNSIAVPNIGRGYPIKDESRCVIKAIVDFHFANPKSPLKSIELVPLDEDSIYEYGLELASAE